MNSIKHPVPGILLGSYPEQRPAPRSFIESLQRALLLPYVVFGGLRASRYDGMLKQIAAHEALLANLTMAQLDMRVLELRQQLSVRGLTTSLKIEALAIVKEMSARVLGVRPYHTQVYAACIILDGKLAEMATGEGKTLAAAVCVAVAALAGIPVHLITSNDYLVVRDAEKSKPLFDALGLTVGTVVQEMDVDPRRKAYACDITYCTAKELAFDYLRDRAIGGKPRSGMHANVSRLVGDNYQPVLRGLCMAIIDEADSILIDEARVPLILSQSVVDEKQVAYYDRALQLAEELQPRVDYVLDHRALSARLTEVGQASLEQKTQAIGSLWRNRMHREETICQALAAKYLFQRDNHYLVRNGMVHIIDEITGRLSPGRVWSRGLHQMIEIKEHCKPSGEMLTAAQITFQRFFPRYLRLGGMSGTIQESAGELFSIFNLMVVRVPLRQPSKRVVLPTRIFQTQQALWPVVVERIRHFHQRGRPVLIGTDSVADSESLSQRLTDAGLPHEVLNARQDQREAAIVARAGELGQITVSTNMAGRGTDIPLGPGVEEIGGLHLIICQHNASRRIDRQLLGRCARQGNPGSAETLISFEKPLIARLFPKWLAKLAGTQGLAHPQWLVKLIVFLPQWLEESHQRAQRKEMLQRDARLELESLVAGD